MSPACFFNPLSPAHRTYMIYVHVRLADGNARIFTALPLFLLLPYKAFRIHGESGVGRVSARVPR